MQINFGRRSVTRENKERSFIYKELLILRNLARKQLFLVEMFIEIPGKELSIKYESSEDFNPPALNKTSIGEVC